MKHGGDILQPPFHFCSIFIGMVRPLVMPLLSNWIANLVYDKLSQIIPEEIIRNLKYNKSLIWVRFEELMLYKHFLYKLNILLANFLLSDIFSVILAAILEIKKCILTWFANVMHFTTMQNFMLFSRRCTILLPISPTYCQKGHQ